MNLRPIIVVALLLLLGLALAAARVAADDPLFVANPPALSVFLPADHLAQHTLHLENHGSSGEVWRLAAEPAAGWLQFSPVSSQTGPGESTGVSLQFDSGGLATGVYTTTLGLYVGIVPPPSPTLTIPLTLTVPAPAVFLPLVARRYPPIPYTPELAPIDNDAGLSTYLVDWSPADLAITYQLQEDDDPAFPSPLTIHDDALTSHTVFYQSLGAWYYRVRACNHVGCGDWSVTRSTVVLPPQTIVIVDNDTAGTLCYQVYETGLGEQCYGAGEHTYGQFTAGTYTFHASGPCGSITESYYYPMGVNTHQFWCGRGLEGQIE